MFSNEKIIETKTCKHCQSSFSITDKDLEFYEKVSPNFLGKKYLIPPPTLCPDCRQQRRLSFNNIRNLYKRLCNATGKPIISIFSPDKLYKVYNQDFWWSDNWNPLNYGQNFDFNKCFFEQFNELKHKVPFMNLYVDSNENSDYVNQSGWSKNCYLSFCSDYCEECHYCSDVYNSKKSIDCTYGFDIENCYFCIDCKNCSNLKYCKNCIDCSNSLSLDNCIGCKNCINCSDLVNNQYFINNKQYSKEEYEKEEKNILLKNEFYNDIMKPKRFYIGKNNENVNGNYLINCKNLDHCFDDNNQEDSKYCHNLKGGKDCYDMNRWGRYSELCYESSAIGENTKNVIFSEACWGNINNLLYCSFCCNNSSNLFGCIGLRNKSYCILNKQYTKEEYEILVPKIIEHMQKTGEWGEFFPSSISPFGYNETVAMEYFQVIFPNHENSPHPNPLPMGEGIQGGGQGIFNWSNYQTPFPKVEKTIQAIKLPNNIKDIPDDILNWAIECEISKKPFKIISQELEFYRKHNLPIPRRHPDRRHLDRMNLRNSIGLFDRKCDKC
ncbi:MAG: hypothetical protein PHE25_00680, partial [Candidatus Gracilibacteria bacterium]|nr:hypothetical protein [Candidatus Gracilibacteria bacterium]